MLMFFFQAEDGIRDKLVTGVQTCALPIYARPSGQSDHEYRDAAADIRPMGGGRRLSRRPGCGERGEAVVAARRSSAESRGPCGPRLSSRQDEIDPTLVRPGTHHDGLTSHISNQRRRQPLLRFYNEGLPGGEVCTSEVENDLQAAGGGFLQRGSQPRPLPPESREIGRAHV